jgi:aminoglycoside/choline kinase family phosphotransferase
LAADASDRRYVRARLGDGSTRILMTHAQPFDPPYLPWERMAGFLAEQGLPVPGIVSRHPREGILVLEDIGDESLQSFLLARPRDEAACEALYAEAVDWIVRLQRRGTPVVAPSLPAYHFALDAIRLGRELEYFHEHFVLGLRSEPDLAASGGASMVGPALRALAAEAGRPVDRVLCHRDYHSRNLMLPPRGRAAGGSLVILDFQDARLGPRAYDLASLLEDPYVDLTDGLRERMTARFLDGISRPGRAPEFAAEYAAVAAQRLLKAAGTFAGQQTRFGVDRYLVYVPRALERARAMLERLPEHHALLRAVERWAAR